MLTTLAENKDVVTNVFVYCGHSVTQDGFVLDNAVAALCLNTGLLQNISALGMKPEIIIDSGRSYMTDFLAFFANESSAQVVADEAKRFGAQGVQFDFEPQVGSDVCMLLLLLLLLYQRHKLPLHLQQNGAKIIKLLFLCWHPSKVDFISVDVSSALMFNNNHKTTTTTTTTVLCPL